MAGINPYDLNPRRTNSGNANPFGTQSVMPQSNMPVSGTTTSSFSTLQNVQEGPTGAMGSQMGVPPQGPQNQPGLLASQMRSRASMAAPAVQRGMGATPMQAQPSMQQQPQQPQQGRQAGQSSAMAMQPTTY